MEKSKEKILSIKESIDTLRKQIEELSNEELEELLGATALGESDLVHVTGGSSNASLTCTLRGLKTPEKH